MSNEFDYDNFDWNVHFKLDKESPSGLVWNRETYSLGGNKLETWIGKPAGALRDVKNGSNKAWKIAFVLNGKIKHFSVHRIIAVLSGMKVNGLVIDHINGISADNRIENLRAVTQAVNSRNCKPQHNSPYGVSGVGSQTDRFGNTYFIARVVINGKRVQKNFPVKLLGVMEAYRQALVARQQMINHVNEKGAGYSDRHATISGNSLDFDVHIPNNSLIRQATRKIKRRTSNTSGIVGVRWNPESRNNSLRATAYWVEYHEGVLKQCSKSFSVLKYGLLPAFSLAVQHRKDVITRLNQLGYGYSIADSE